MKICKDCNFCDRQTAQNQHGNFALVTICRHEECRDPISGEPLTAATARTQDVFCGVRGRYWKAKETTEEVVENTNVIQLA